ncbi:sensory histidine kinase DcuS [Poriferisphaera corsica]|uniref:histidine kinase n=1 Tax=Poriferisphaera corsica TaxID=2528020 RepID=A0A517YYQ0_9BACT|nr:ATP-binding protein [Poriferisphaera corsica]QDU35353.1 sensory histidine kinase DcuS [Poriferisphaera corsica]
MPTERNNPNALEPTQANDPVSEDARRLAHELANLLDGSMRSLGLAIRSLDTENPHDLAPHQQADKAIKRIQTADTALRQMASLIHEWMETPASQRKSLSWITNASHHPTHCPLSETHNGNPQTLAHGLNLVIELHEQQAKDLHCDLITHINPQAAQLPFGPLFGVLENLIKNALEAITDPQPNARHRIEINCDIYRQSELHITIEDTAGGSPDNINLGHTTKPNGHGIGLSLCRDIIIAMSGSIEFLNGSKGLRIVIKLPVSSLTDQWKDLNG